MFALSIWMYGSVAIVIKECMAETSGRDILLYFGFYTLFVVMVALLVYSIFCCCTSRQQTMRGRMSRLFSMFSHIETLVLHIAEDDPNSNLDEAFVLCVSRQAFKGVKINRLEVKSHCVKYLLRLVSMKNILMSVIASVKSRVGNPLKL